MAQNIAVNELENARKKILREHLKKEVLEQLESIEKAIALLKSQQDVSASISPNSSALPATSLQALVVNAVVELIHRAGRPVRNEEILAFLDEKQITLGDAKNKNGALAGILFQENKRKDGKIKRVTRGTYHLK